MNVRPRTLAVVTAIAAAGALTACVPEPTPGTIDVIGDSLTAQATRYAPNWAEGAPAGSDIYVDAVVGSRFEGHQPRVEERAANGRPAVLTVALGLNSFGDGWTTTDLASFKDLIATPHPSTCVVVLLPQAGAGASANFLANNAIGRTDMRSAALERPNSVIIDWKPVADAHPEYLQSDGIHLVGGTSGAYKAYNDLRWAGAAACPAT